MQLKRLNIDCCVQISKFQPVFKLRTFWNRMSGVLWRRYSVFIHSGNARRRTPDSRTYFIWRMTETWVFGHNNLQQNNFNCILTEVELYCNYNTNFQKWNI